MVLPDAEGPNTTLSEKVYVPVKEHPDRVLQLFLRFKDEVAVIFVRVLPNYSVFIINFLVTEVRACLSVEILTCLVGALWLHKSLLLGNSPILCFGGAKKRSRRRRNRSKPILSQIFRASKQSVLGDSPFNFVGRILGPRGMTAKQLELETGCKIMVRGKGSMRDKKKEEQNRGKPNWEHLNDELHVLITVEDTENRAKVKLQRAVEEVKKLLVPVADGEDELKKRQLMELAIINGTYRDSSAKAIAGAVSDDDWRRLALVAAAAETQRLLGGPGGGGGGGGIPGMAPPMRPPTAPLGAPLILSPRIPVPTSSATLLNGSGPPHPPPPPPLISAADAAAAAAGLIYNPYPTAADYANYAALASPLLAEYASATAADHHAEEFSVLIGFLVEQLSNGDIWVSFGNILIKGQEPSHEKLTCGKASSANMEPSLC
ncbi:hypothetical protein J437_LFUL017478 [Ladona fulva]|uniref:K Homology domain-containing protein n=1 Tax=Ladona fulva TaxID=123851 RepID=A0A8K0KP18_LADFU|nr:hypothetical protein J437_LFUL017478 [Ladona fulva]